MFQRVLWVSLTQALRSVALVLLPTAFISLLAWATAGSTNGNTSDPMRFTLWLWLAAHHVPFHLVLPPAGQPGFFSYLPLGAIIFPFLAIRSGYIRAMNRLDFEERSLRLMRSAFSVIYAAIATLLAWGSMTTAVKPVLYYVPLTSFLLVWLATATVRDVSSPAAFSSISLAIRFIAISMGIASIVLGVSLAFHLKTIQNLVVVLQPGWLGAILLFILNLLYLPNAIVATLAYMVGPGFAVGAHTLVAPLTHRILEIPALPLLGALPTGRHPLVLLCTLAVCVGGAAIYFQSVSHNVRAVGKSYLFAVGSVALIAFLSSGSLITKSMGAMGASTWQLTSAIGVEVAVGILFAWLIPFVYGSVLGRRGSH